MKLALALACIALCVGCKSPPSDAKPQAIVPAASAAASAPASKHAGAKPPTCEAAPGWRFEEIALPPEFAPTLPSGVEHLYFAPGMFKEGDPGYWTYVFSLRFDKPLAVDHASTKTLLTDYYSGLISAVAGSKSVAVPDPAAVVELTAAVRLRDNGFVATVKTVDAFVTAKPIEVTLDLQFGPQKDCINVAASVAPRSDAIWTELTRARACVPCQ